MNVKYEYIHMHIIIFLVLNENKVILLWKLDIYELIITFLTPVRAKSVKKIQPRKEKQLTPFCPSFIKSGDVRSK